MHKLKTWPKYYQAIKLGKKNFEVRKNDRGYYVGDILQLWEFDPSSIEYTGESLERRVVYIMHGPAFGLKAEYVVMALEEIEEKG